MLLLFVSFLSLTGEDFAWRDGLISPRIRALENRPQAVDSFWRDMKARGAPLIEPIPGDSSHVLVTFLYRAQTPTTGVVLASQLMAGRDIAVNVLTHLPNTDIWYKTYSIRTDMRLSYSFVPNPTAQSLANGALQIPDPLNSKTLPVYTGIGRSVLELAAAPRQPWVAPRSGVPPGKLAEEQIDSKILKSQRKAWVYTPAGYDANRTTPYPLLVCFDGLAFGSTEQVPTPTIIDNLIAEHRIPPIVLLLVGQSPQPVRNLELSNNPVFLSYVTDELVPQVRRKWRVTSDPSQTIVCGSSAGGLASAYFAFNRPDVFGNVLSQSGAFWPGKERDDPEHEWLTAQFAGSKKLPIRFVLQVGLLETGPTPLNGPSILTSNHHLREVLTAKGYELHYSEIAGGHEPINWRGGIGDGMIQLIGLDHPPVDAVQGIVAAFEKHPVVIIGEARHWLHQTADFYIRLTREPAFQNTVQDIVIEFASRNNQPLLDRYIGGEDVPIEQLRHLWRDTTKVASWESPVYPEWLAAIRDVNKTLPPARRLRVLAGDTAIDWNRIHTHAEWDALGDNNISFAEVITSQVLDKRRRALVVLGGNHVTKSGDRTGAANTTTRIEARRPGSTYVVMHHLAPESSIEGMLRAKMPSLYDLAGTALGETPDPNGVPPLKYVDAWLYLGPRESMTEALPAPGSIEADYIKEVDRRSMIEWGELRARKLLGSAIYWNFFPPARH